MEVRPRLSSERFVGVIFFVLFSTVTLKKSHSWTIFAVDLHARICGPIMLSNLAK